VRARCEGGRDQDGLFHMSIKMLDIDRLGSM
jgi:hypothetical protein